ncbi:MAG: radical SAM protein [Vicinamibacterales bacterium]
MQPHPRGVRARILLSSVFKPFAQDDEFGSRAMNPVELYHNQVTREQGPFSLRMFHRTWSLMLLQRNISAPCTVLDFPTRAAFVRELETGGYDVVGLTGIIVNVGKIREMCRLARRHAPGATIVVGGHVAAIPGIETMIDADHVVKGEGVAWLRAFLGEDPGRPVEHPLIPSSFGFRLFGLPAPRGGGNAAATIIPSVGCPMGCNFCTTSEFFGGKGKSVTFLPRGADVFRVMAEAEQGLGARAFFMMDENFLLYRKRALELLDLMKARGKAWSLYVFSSANAIRQYDPRQLVELGVEWIWLGLESSGSQYRKLQGTDTQALARELQAHGIRVHGSTIIGLEHHTPDNIVEVIDHAVAHETVFHQFMLYTPVPGTPLYREVEAAGRLLEHVDLADIHGQDRFNFRHQAISREQSKAFLDRAFRRDYEVNGPSLYRLMASMFTGWRRYRDDPDPRVRARVAGEARQLRTGYGAALWAMERYLRESNRTVSERIRDLRLRVEREIGGLSPVVDRLAGPVLLWSARRDARLAPAGRRLEPRTFVDRRNWSAALAPGRG